MLYNDFVKASCDNSRNVELIKVKSMLEYNLNSIAKQKGMTLEEIANQKPKIELKCNNEKKADLIAQMLNSKALEKEEEITNDIKLLESIDAKLINLETKVKDSNSLSKKILRDSMISKKSIEEISYEIYDTIRYTLVIDDKTYINNVEKSLNLLLNLGYKIILNKFKNKWGNTIYQGINVGLITPYDVKIEIQFHTNQSFVTKEYLNHTYYEIYRNLFANTKERQLAYQIMRINQALVHIPDKAINYTYKNIAEENETEKNKKYFKIKVK